MSVSLLTFIIQKFTEFIVLKLSFIYSDALEKVIFPVLNKHVDGELCFSHQQFPEESQIEDLLCVLQSFNALNKKPFSKLVEKLCWQLESFITGINKHLAFQESEVHNFYCS